MCCESFHLICGESDPVSGINNNQSSCCWSCLLTSYRGIGIELRLFHNQLKTPCSGFKFINPPLLFFFQSKQRSVKIQSVSEIGKQVEQCFTTTPLTLYLVSTLSFHPQLSCENQSYTWSEVGVRCAHSSFYKYQFMCWKWCMHNFCAYAYT